MTIDNSMFVTEIKLLIKRPWVGTPRDSWKDAKRFEDAFNCPFEEYARSNWLGKKTSELGPLHKDWAMYAQTCNRNLTCKLYILPKGSFSAFLDDLKDGTLKDRNV